MSVTQKLILILMLPSLALSQSITYPVPDSTNQLGVHPNLLLLPLWTPPTTSATATKPDSLLPLVLPELTRSKPLNRLPRWLGLGLITAGSALSYYYHQQAEETYQEYLTSGNPAELNKLFYRAERFDRLSGWWFVGAEAGLVLVSLSVVFAP
ncbi:hypothetical protein ACFL4U_00690 [Candidatus Neomarinimicrobiota bacterium]